jgi:AhpD family alkylhydroperoxidase
MLLEAVEPEFFVLHLSHPSVPPGHHHDHPEGPGVTTQENAMKARMTSPVFVLPDAMKALQNLHKAIGAVTTVPATTHYLMHVRASQINGCSVCVEMHAREMKEAGEPDEKIWAVGAWRESPRFTDAERAALALAESVTRIADNPDAVPDAVWDEAADVYDEKELSALLLSIAGINVWNRLNCATRQPSGQTW